MKPIKQFEEFIKENIVKKQTPDKSRAEFLTKESERDYKYLLKLIEQIKITDENANLIVKSCYDILMQTIRAKMLLEGYNATGQGAHEAETSYTRNLKFNEKEVQFLDQIRYFRNGMLYYGTILDKEYAKQVLEFTKTTYSKLN